MWWGKLIGGFFGALLAGPIGMALGVLIGHAFDRSLISAVSFNQSSGGAHTQAQEIFFNATFLVMGYVAKSDGHVSKKEIRAAEIVMAKMGLSGDLKEKAIHLFREGKQPSFNLDKTLNDLLLSCHRNPILLQMFVEIQWQVAHADGALSAGKRQILQKICRQLGIGIFNFSSFEDFFRTAQEQQSHYQRTPSHPSKHNLSAAYQLLGISETAQDAEVKKAYRLLMSKNHPDKLIAKGLPEEMVKLATEKTQNIRAAYDLICKTRGMKGHVAA
jgi:DnaJ like chaperone protein